MGVFFSARKWAICNVPSFGASPRPAKVILFWYRFPSGESRADVLDRVKSWWYRFPTGESRAEVLDRVKSWWYESVLRVNVRVGYAPIDGIVEVTHGLTLRFILMQLFGWSPTTFHSIWNRKTATCTCCART